MKALIVKDIHTYYGDSYVLQGLSLEVTNGTTVALLGRNGVGKTTLISSIMGIIHPRRGSIIFKDQNITQLPPFRINSLGIGIVPQGRRVFSSLSAEENLAVAFRQQGVTRWSMDRVVAVFPGLAKRLKSRAGHLSGGEQQMLAIARTLVGNPTFLMMDEPTEGISPMMVEEVGRVIREVGKEGISVLLVEQNVRFALELAEYVYLMSKGVIVHECPPSDLWQRTDVLSKYLGL
jgi:branched-chain amino acid transport system ATP-binding protein